MRLLIGRVVHRRDGALRGSSPARSRSSSRGIGSVTVRVLQTRAAHRDLPAAVLLGVVLPPEEFLFILIVQYSEDARKVRRGRGLSDRLHRRGRRVGQTLSALAGVGRGHELHLHFVAVAVVASLFVAAAAEETTSHSSLVLVLDVSHSLLGSAVLAAVVVIVIVVLVMVVKPSHVVAGARRTGSGVVVGDHCILYVELLLLDHRSINAFNCELYSYSYSYS